MFPFEDCDPCNPPEYDLPCAVEDCGVPSGSTFVLPVSLDEDMYDLLISSVEAYRNGNPCLDLLIYMTIAALSDALCGVTDVASQFQLRQSENSPCILEQSFDGGVSWIDAFDYSLCLGTLARATDISITQVIITLNQIYTDQGNSGLAPNMAQSPQQAQREAAFCYAMDLWARSVFAAAKKRREGELRRDKLIEGIVGAGAVFLGLITGGVSAILAAVAAGAVLALTANEIENLSAEEYADENAIQTLICCIADQFIDPAGTNFDHEVVRIYIDDCVTGLTPDSVEQRLAEVLSASFIPVDSWIAFTQLCADAFTLVGAGIAGCQCECIAFSAQQYVWNDIEVAEIEWEGVLPDPTWIPGNEQGAAVRVDFGNWHFDADAFSTWGLRYNIGEGLLSQVGVRMFIPSNNSRKLRVRARLVDTGQWVTVGSYSAGLVGSGSVTRNFSFSSVCVDTIQFEVWGKFDIQIREIKINSVI